MVHALFFGGTAQSKSKTITNAGGRIGAAFFEDSAAQGLGGFDIDGIIERDVSVQRCVGGDAFNRAGFSARTVESRHARVRHRSPPEGVKATAVSIFAGTRGIGPLAVERCPPQAFRLRRINAWPANL